MVTAMTRSSSSLRVARCLAALAAGLAAAAHAGLYKCAAERGAVIYQDAACAPGHELRDLERDPAQLSIVPGTPVPRTIARAEPAPARAAKVHTATAKARGGDPAERRFLRLGMTEAEVLYKIGRPDVKLSGRRGDGRQWSYLPTAGDANTLTTVTFAGGQVTHVERKVVR